MDQTSILIVDDHPLIAIGLESALSKINQQIKFFNAQNGADALKLLRKQPFDIVFLDVFIPDTDTHNLLHQIKSIRPDLKILMFSSGNQTIYAPHYLKQGAHGFLQKGATETEIRAATEAILNGRLYLTEDQVENGLKLGKEANPFEKLSAREMEVAKLLADGKKVTEIARTLNLHTSTIGTQKARILDKLSLKSQHEFEELARLHQFK